jgi:predicted anti-sigma-YlaC factor YlaD
MKAILAFAYFATIALGGGSLVLYVAGLVSAERCDGMLLAGVGAALAGAVWDSAGVLGETIEDASGMTPREFTAGR